MYNANVWERKTMKKKLFSVFAIVLCLIPLCFFAGCKGDDTAKNVLNRIYVVSRADRDFESDTTILDNKLRISFFEEGFKVEYGFESKNSKTYGYYLGTYTTTKTTVQLEITKYGGIFKDGISTDLKLTKELRYEKGKLVVEFLGTNDKFMQYEFVEDKST